jgi:hypothetical protein
MDINADVKSIDKLRDYFFIVPDYQREYVWKVDDQVEQFLADIDDEYEPGAKTQSNYFIGSIIIVEQGEKYDVIDGQQRLTTIVLSICAIRDLLEGLDLDPKQKKYLGIIKDWLSDFDMHSDQVQLRLELQYEESKDYLNYLIEGSEYDGYRSESIKKMQQAYARIREHLEGYLRDGLTQLVEYARYFLTGIDLVVIESENLSSALKIFETINQRGSGLNAMDLVKNLLFSEAREDEFVKIKNTWRELIGYLEKCGEGQSPLRFLKYFMVARYHQGMLREDTIYKWIISNEGKSALNYQTKPLVLAKELKTMAERYSRLVLATQYRGDGSEFPSITNIGFINKYRSRQHLVLLLALDAQCPDETIEYLGQQIESFLFFTNTMGIQSKYNENSFSQWALKLRGTVDTEGVKQVISETMTPYLVSRFRQFKDEFLTIRHTSYNPQYRQRFVLGRLENTVRKRSGLPQQGHDFAQKMQIEHILPQTPKNGQIPESYEDIDNYYSMVYRLGNVSLLESQINQAVNNYNDLVSNWFHKKQNEYRNSDVVLTNLLDDDYSIGKNTGLNRFRDDTNYRFLEWDSESIETRQKILMDIAIETWLICDQRLDSLND